MFGFSMLAGGGGIDLAESFARLWRQAGIFAVGAQWGQALMLAIAGVLLFLAIVKKFEPLLLLPIGFGMFIINIPGAAEVLMEEPSVSASGKAVAGGLFYYIEKGVSWVIFPPIIFLGIGAMTDFGPMIANPKTILLGAAAQLGIFVTFIFGAFAFSSYEMAASVAIIGGADGPTAIYLATMLSPDMVAPIAIAAYSYMALIPIIQRPLMKLLVPKRERMIRMEQLREVSRAEKIIYPLVVSAIVGVVLPMSIPLIGMLMLGNLLKESGVVERLAKTASNELINIVTIFLGVIVGTKATAGLFLEPNTLKIIGLGLGAFIVATIGGLLFGRLMCLATKGKVNPLIGAAGVSAVPMAARVAHNVAREDDPDNYLLMHAMGPNVAGVIGSAIAAGVLLALFGG